VDALLVDVNVISYLLADCCWQVLNWGLSIMIMCANTRNTTHTFNWMLHTEKGFSNNFLLLTRSCCCLLLVVVWCTHASPLPAHFFPHPLTMVKWRKFPHQQIVINCHHDDIKEWSFGIEICLVPRI
jgi:hypothetical protein